MNGWPIVSWLGGFVTVGGWLGDILCGSGTELSMGPFSITQPNRSNHLRDPTQRNFVLSPNPLEPITPKIQEVDLY
jgi:hypothetical protein